MTFAILAAAAVTFMTLALMSAKRPEPRRVPVRIRDRDPRLPPR